MARGLLVIVAKDPIPGLVKTRLSPPLSPGEAADLYRLFLQDTLGEMGSIEGLDKAIAYTPAGARESFALLAQGRFDLFVQRGADLGEMVSNIFSQKLGEGYEAVGIINSDSPDLRRERVEESFALLGSDQAEAVFGPCQDGGYYLVALKKFFPELFTDIPWSTERVLAVTLEKARGKGIRTALLAPWRDIDTFEELLAFYRRCLDQPPSGPWPGENTFRLLDRMAKVTQFAPNPGGRG